MKVNVCSFSLLTFMERYVMHRYGFWSLLKTANNGGIRFQM